MYVTDCPFGCFAAIIVILGIGRCVAGEPASQPTTRSSIQLTVEAEDVVLSDRYSNNGSMPTWCFGSTCIVRVGADVFVSGVERVPGAQPLNDCRWVLMKRTAAGWERQQTDPGRTREPSPIAVLPPNRVLISANPAVASGGNRPEVLEFDATGSKAKYRTLLPAWADSPGFGDHTYRSLASDPATGEAVLFYAVGYTHAVWSLLGRDGRWVSGKLAWPAFKPGELGVPDMTACRVGYPNVVLRDRALHYCGAGAYNGWDRVKTEKDLGTGGSFIAGRQRGNRFRRLWYTTTPRLGEKPFIDWVDVDNTFADGGWVFPGDMHLDAAGTVHLVWFRSPMLPSVRDEFYKDIKRVYRICYATIRDGKVLTRRTLLTAGEGADPCIPTDPDGVGRPYVLVGGERILGDSVGTVRFHVTPDGRLFVVYYVSGKQPDGREISENRIMELGPDGTPGTPLTIPLKAPLCQFFTATPRAGSASSWTLDLYGFRRGGWKPREGTDYREYDGTMCYAQVRLSATRPEGPTRVIVVGDSTVANYSAADPMRGWGQMLPPLLGPGAKVVNLAASGRSTKTFLAEKLWDAALAQCRPGDLVLIQFGHNDSHGAGRPESTDAATEFRANLRQYVADVRQRGGVPVLVSPMHRRRFDRQGKLTTELGPYAESARLVAVETKAAFVDLHELSGRAMAALGDAGCADLFCSPEDRTHFSRKGATLMAGLVAQGLRSVSDGSAILPVLPPATQPGSGR